MLGKDFNDKNEIDSQIEHKSRAIDIESLEIVIDRVMESKLAQFSEIVDNTRSSLNKNVKHDHLVNFVKEEESNLFTEDQFNQHVRKKMLQAKLNTVVGVGNQRIGSGLTKDDLEIILNKAKSLLQKKSCQSDILILCKESKDLLNRAEGRTDLHGELLALKSEMTSLIGQIEDPTLSFMWSSEFNK